MKFEEYLQKNKTGIKNAINKSFLEWQKNIGTKKIAIKELADVLLASNQGGKNIRGGLVHLGYDLYTNKKSSEISQIAAAYEILHTSLLIHDDIIDKSLVRRGEKTVFQKLGGDHYGISQAICLGDIGFFLATQMMSNSKFPDGIKTKVISQFSQIVLDTVAGEMLDVKFANKIGEVNATTVIKIAKLKTAYYTIAGPLLIGALIAGAESKQLTALAHFGENLGIAYQIKDDILGVFGEEKVIGKSVTSDIEEGKNTLLIVHALAKATDKQRAFLLQHYGRGSLSQKNYEFIKDIFETTGARLSAERKAQAYINKAKSIVNSLTSTKQYQILLNDFILMVTTRQK